MIFTRSDGVQVDMATGEVVGQTEPKQVSTAQARYPETGGEVYPESSGKTALDALKQLSWNANAALLALPDAGIAAVGRAFGVKEDEIPTLVKYFNRGQTAPKNAVERFAAAIGQGIGAGLPLTGTLGAVARTKALSGPLLPNAPITKQIAKETLDLFRTNPKAAIALDVGFGAAYGATEQAVRETTEPGQTREVLEATVPFAATVALPLGVNKVVGMALKLSPTAFALRKAREQMGGFQESIIPASDIAQAVEETTPKIPLLRGPMNFIGKLYGKFAASDISKKIGQSLELVGEAKTQEQLRLTDELLKFASDNGFDGKFAFNLAESTLNPYLRQAYNEAVGKGISGEMRKTILLKNEERDRAFEELAKKLTPEAQLGLQDALILNASERTKAVDDVLSKIKGLDEAERTRLKDAFEQDTTLADIGNSLRRLIFVGREGLLSQFRMKVDELTRRPFGVRAATRVEGLPIEGIPAIPFQDFATGFTNKYNLTTDNRFFGGEVPGPAKDILRTMSKAKDKQEEVRGKALDEVIHEYKLKTSSYYKNTTPKEQADQRAVTAEGLKRGFLNKPEDLALLAEAEKRVGKYSQLDITLPEAMDLLLNAQKFRTSMFLKAQNDKEYGAGGVFADQVDRFGKEVLRDVEDFIFRRDKYGKGFTDVPGIKDLENAYRSAFDNGFDKLFPLMATQKRPSGEFKTGDQKLVEELFKNRENLRSLNALFGDSPLYVRNLQQAVLLRAKDFGVIDNNGMLNEAAYNRFLSRNKSVIDYLPESVQKTLRDEVTLGQAFANERAALMAQKESLADLELDKIVKEAIRPDADTKDFVMNALNKPADMRKLIDTVGKDPEKLQAIRRNVWETMVGKMLDPNDPILLSQFKTKYGKSLNMLYPTPTDQRNLDMIAALQERILAVMRPPEDLTPFRTFEEKLRQYVGAGVGTLESTVRAAAIRIISPTHAAVSLATRFVARQQQGVAERILLNALIDEKYAKEFIDASASIETEKGFKQASKIAYNAGASLPFFFRMVTPGIKAANIEAVQALEDQDRMRPLEQVPRTMAPFQAPAETRAPQRPVPRMPAPPLSPTQQYEQDILSRQGLRPPVPASRSVPQMPSGQAGQNTQMYQALFPNDPVSELLRARQQTSQ